MNGFSDICHHIIIQKNKLELEDIKNEYIESHSYYWLMYDLYLRQFININIINKYIFDWCNYDLHNIIDYYNLNLLKLGLNNEFRRTKSLTQCYNEYWKTIKNDHSNRWKVIHKIINYPYDLIFYNMDDLYHDDIFTNYLGITISKYKQLLYLEKIYTDNPYKIRIYHNIILFQIDEYIVKYIHDS